MKGEEFAFPVANTDVHYDYYGLSKREYFAVMAMQGLLSADNQAMNHILAKYSVDMADELIAALNGE